MISRPRPILELPGDHGCPDRADMDNNQQNGLQPEQWLPVFDKGEKRASSLGSGALRFIRTRSSIRRELKRQCSR